MVEHPPCKRVVGSSKLSTGTILASRFAEWGSGLSRLAHNQKIAGSNPASATNLAIDDSVEVSNSVIRDTPIAGQSFPAKEIG